MRWSGSRFSISDGYTISRCLHSQRMCVIMHIYLLFTSGIRDNYTFRTRKRWKVAFLRLLPGSVPLFARGSSTKVPWSRSKWDARCAINILLEHIIVSRITRVDFSPIGLSLSYVRQFRDSPRGASSSSDNKWRACAISRDFHLQCLLWLSADRWSAIITDPSVLGGNERPHFYLEPPSIIRSYRRIWPTDRADRYNPLIEWNRCYSATDRNVRAKEIRRMKYGRSTRWLVDFRAMAASPLPSSWELSHETWSVSNFICHL